MRAALATAKQAEEAAKANEVEAPASVVSALGTGFGLVVAPEHVECPVPGPRRTPAEGAHAAILKPPAKIASAMSCRTHQSLRQPQPTVRSLR